MKNIFICPDLYLQKILNSSKILVFVFLGLLSCTQLYAQAMGQGMGAPEIEQPKKEKREHLKIPSALGENEESARDRAKKPGMLLAAKAKKNKIFMIDVLGARKVESDAILVYIHSRVGQSPSVETTQEDVRRIYRMGLFQDVVVRSEEGPNGSIKLHYNLIEKPALGDVIFEGNHAISDDEIREVVNLRAFQVLDVPRIQKNMVKIKKLFVDKGYYLAEVDYKVVSSKGPSKIGKEDDGNIFIAFKDFLVSEGLLSEEKKSVESLNSAEGDDLGRFVNVVFTIKENKKISVEEIRFVGNNKISDDKLKNHMGTHEKHPFGILTDWGTYKEELANIDPLALEATYQDQGYINARVLKPHVEMSSDRERLTLSFPVSEGEQYSLRSFDIQGDLLIEAKDEYDQKKSDNPAAVYFLKSNLLRDIKVKKGDIFSRSKVGMDIQALTNRYKDRGYAYVQILPQTALFKEDKTLALSLSVVAGPRVRVERIEIHGNSKTQDRVIRREIQLYEGDWFSEAKLRHSEARVQALGFFENVAVKTSQGSTADRLVVRFDLTEKSTGTFQIGAGYSNGQGLLFNGQIAMNNLFGRGVTLSGSGQWSNFSQIIDLRYIDPYAFYLPLLGSYEPVTFAFSVFNTRRLMTSFSRNSLGGDVTFGYPIGRPLRPLVAPLFEEVPTALYSYIPDPNNLQFFLTTKGERVEIQDGSFNVNLLGLRAYVPHYTSSLRAALIFDNRDNRLRPSKGYYFSAGAEYAQPWMGADLFAATEKNLSLQLRSLGLKDGFAGISQGLLKQNGDANSFVRYNLNSRVYFSMDPILPYKGVVLKANFELGLLDTKNKNLIFERYYLGGLNTIRGYFPRSIGPVRRVGGRQPNGELVEFQIGGNKQIYTNLELIIPIIEQVGIRGVLFFDAGNAYAADENLFYLGNPKTDYLQSINCLGKRCWDPRNSKDLPLGLFTSVGFGVRWFSPMGPLRFEWAIPLNPRPIGTFGMPSGDQPFMFQFNIGNSF